MIFNMAGMSSGNSSVIPVGFTFPEIEFVEFTVGTEGIVTFRFQDSKIYKSFAIVAETNNDKEYFLPLMVNKYTNSNPDTYSGLVFDSSGSSVSPNSASVNASTGLYTYSIADSGYDDTDLYEGKFTLTGAYNLNNYE